MCTKRPMLGAVSSEGREIAGIGFQCSGYTNGILRPDSTGFPIRRESRGYQDGMKNA